MQTHYETIFDIAIIGGGFAGAALAAVLSRKGISTAVIDLHALAPREFRAEKIGRQQLDLLHHLGLGDIFFGLSTPNEWMLNVWRGRVIDLRRVEEHGAWYHDMVAGLRTAASGATWFIGRAAKIELRAHQRGVTLHDGRHIRARLVVLASGVADSLRRSLGIERRLVQLNQCLAVGLTLQGPEALRLSGRTYYGDSPKDALDYVSFFKIGHQVRANGFIYADATSKLLQSLKSDPLATLSQNVPSLAGALSGCVLAERPNLHVVDLYECTNVVQEGLVLIGDAFRTSCPSVGTGLSCALTDVQVLTMRVPAWLASPHSGNIAQIQGFYDSSRKVKQDFKAHHLAKRRRKAVRGEEALLYAGRLARFALRMVRSRLVLRQLSFRWKPTPSKAFWRA